MIVEDNKKEEEHNIAPTIQEQKIKLEDTKLDTTGKAFLKEWNIEINGDITSSLKK
jgi:hypothetical protein